MSDIFNFIDKKLLEIKPPKKGQVVYRDQKEQGLILRVSYAGTKSFYLYKRIETKPRMIKIGKFPNTSIAEARIAARELKNKIEQGKYKLDDKYNVKDITFKNLFDKYIDDYARYNSKSWKEIVKAINKNARSLFDQNIAVISKVDILSIFHVMTSNGKYGANRFLDILKAIFNKAIEWELLDKNPAAGIKKHKEKSRDRYITLEEKDQFFEAVYAEENQTIKDFVLIALYTGARKSNVLSMRWEDVDFGNSTWHLKDTKNGDPQNVVLTEDAIRILEARKKDSSSRLWVFPSPNSASGHLQEPRKGWKRIVKRAGLNDLRIHDLRRTCGSWMALSGASQYVIGKALNHKSPQTTAIYARLSLDPVREFMEKSAKLTNVDLQKKIEEMQKKNEP